MIGPPGNVRIYLACGVTDMRNYAERRIMRSAGRLAVTFIGLARSTAPHNSWPSPAAKHGQELVRRPEPAGLEIWRHRYVQRLQFLGGISPQIGFGALKTGVT